MNALLGWLLGTAKFVPHGVCLLWRPDLVAIHVGSDTLIALSYFAIPGVIWWFVDRRRDLQPEHRRIALLFAAFITACGLTHVAAIVTLWAPYYGLQALIKLATAAVSVITAASLPFLAPRLLLIPSPAALQMANGRLEAEVSAHRATLRELEAAQDLLKRQVADRDEDLRETNARFTEALEGSPVTLFEQDEALRYTWAFNSPLAEDSRDLIGKSESDFLTSATAADIHALKRQALETGAPQQGEFPIDYKGRKIWVDLHARRTLLRDGRPGLIASAMNITALKQQQEHLQLVLRELNHRSKNLLTIVQSIARQTAVGLEVPAAFLLSLGDRLRALAAAHDVLVQTDWRGADLQTVIETQLKHHPRADGRIEMRGEPVALPPEAAHYVGLAVHELGVNAVKYGALSGAEGHVEIGWAVEQDAAIRRLRLVWRERGGPPVSPAAGRGFGRAILEVLAPNALAGEATLSFETDGVVWTLVAPMGG